MTSQFHQQQHDIQELFSVLFEALERSDPPRFKKINGLWQGLMLQYIQPVIMTDISQRHVRSDSFIDIQANAVVIFYLPPFSR